MRNTTAFVLGLLSLILSGLAFLFPYYVDSELKDILCFIFYIIGINGSIFIMIGGIFDSKKLSSVGFGIGIGSFTIILIILAIVIPKLLSMVIAFDVVFLYDVFLFGYMFGIHPNDYNLLMLAIIALSYRRSYEIMFAWDIIQVCLMSGCITVSSISFGVVISKK